MPIIKSAIKRAKQSITRRSRNLQTKRAVKADIAAVYTSVEAGDAAEVQKSLAAAYSEIDRAVKKGTLHKNTAARRKAQLAAAVNVKTDAKVDEAPAKTTKGAGKSATKTTAKKPAATKKPAVKKTPAKKAEAK